MNNILITGGSGFIGSEIAHLIQSEYRVTVWDLKPSMTYCTWKNIDVIKFVPEKVDFDCIIHLAAKACLRECINDPYNTYITNVIGTMNMLETARLSKAQFIFMSSSVVNEPTKNIYGMTKFQGEQLCKLYYQSYQVPTIMLRPFNVYGDEGRTSVVSVFRRQTLNKQPLTIYGDGSQRYDYVHVEDIASAIRKAIYAEKHAQSVELGTGVNYSVLEIAKMFQPNNILIDNNKISGELEETLADTTDSLTKLGWTAKISLPAYIQNFRQSYRL